MVKNHSKRVKKPKVAECYNLHLPTCIFIQLFFGRRRDYYLYAFCF